MAYSNVHTIYGYTQGHSEPLWEGWWVETGLVAYSMQNLISSTIGCLFWAQKAPEQRFLGNSDLFYINSLRETEVGEHEKFGAKFNVFLLNNNID